MQFPIELLCLEHQRTEYSALVVTRKIMENYAMLDPIDKHILFLEYSGRSSHTGKILLSLGSIGNIFSVLTRWPLEDFNDILDE